MMQEMGPMSAPEIGPQITPPTPEAPLTAPENPVLSVEKGGKLPERPPQVEEKYKVEKIRSEEPKENIEEEMRSAREELDRKFNESEGKEKEPQIDLEKKNYYDRLGVHPNASPEEIMEAYLKFSKKTHPDVGGGKEEFKKIQEAFEILHDQDKRDKYDSELVFELTDEDEIKDGQNEVEHKDFKYWKRK